MLPVTEGPEELVNARENYERSAVHSPAVLTVSYFIFLFQAFRAGSHLLVLFLVSVIVQVSVVEGK